MMSHFRQIVSPRNITTWLSTLPCDIICFSADYTSKALKPHYHYIVKFERSITVANIRRQFHKTNRHGCRTCNKRGFSCISCPDCGEFLKICPDARGPHLLQAVQYILAKIGGNEEYFQAHPEEAYVSLEAKAILYSARDTGHRRLEEQDPV